MARKSDDPMERARRLFDKSGISLEELGKRMGYSESVARKAAWQFLNKTSDPRLSMVRRFAEALNVSPCELVK